MTVSPPKESMLLLAHMLLMQRDLPGLMHMFHDVCASFLPYTHAALAVEASFLHNSKLYLQNTEKKTVTEAPFQVAYIELCRQYRFRFLEPAHVERSFPLLVDFIKSDSADASPLEGAHLCLLPLRIPVNGYHAVLLLWIATKTDPEHVQMLNRIVNGVFSVVVARVLETFELQKEADEIRRERDLLILLQGIVTSAQTCSDIAVLLDHMAFEVCRFLGVRELCLYVFEDTESITVHCARHVGDESPPVPRTVDRAQSLVSVVTDASWTLLSQAVLSEHTKADPASAFLLARGCTEACAFPLVVHGRRAAVLLVGAESSLLTDTVIDDLAQLAFCLGPVVQAIVRESAGAHDEAFEEVVLEAENVASRPEYADLVGQSKSLSYVLAQVDLVAQSDSTVLLLGETGTGKELIAQAVHKRSSRAKKSFITLNCAAVPKDLLESELFGHEKGAFTGATSQHKGRFERAQGGTLFLDEIGELPLELQPKLLRILQTREMERVGGQTLITLDVRIVAATNRDLKQMVAQGQFRDDLYYRLNVFPIRIPPLRERTGDIPLLVHTYTKRFCERMGKPIPTISKRVMAWFCAQDWPGNIRELVNVVERAVIMTSGSELVLPRDTLDPVGFSPAAHHVLDTIPQDRGARVEPVSQPRVPDGPEPAHNDERTRIISAVLEANGVVAGPRGAAARLGLKRTTLLSRMKRLNLSVKEIMESYSEKPRS